MATATLNQQAASDMYTAPSKGGWWNTIRSTSSLIGVCVCVCSPMATLANHHQIEIELKKFCAIHDASRSPGMLHTAVFLAKPRITTANRTLLFILRTIGVGGPDLTITIAIISAVLDMPWQGLATDIRHLATTSTEVLRVALQMLSHLVLNLRSCPWKIMLS